MPSPSNSSSWAKASRSMPARASSNQALLIANQREGNRPIPCFLPQRIGSSTGVRPVADLDVLQRAGLVAGVGGRDLVPPAIDGVEQVQLGTRVGAFPAGDQPGAGR